VLGCNAKGKPIAEPEEIPEECGVQLVVEGSIHVLRTAPKRPAELSFQTWMALAKSKPTFLPEEAQAMLS
jgi:hypothetical protein